MGTVIQRKIDTRENDKYLSAFSRSQKSQDASGNTLDLYTKQDLYYDDTILSYKNMSNKLSNIAGNAVATQTLAQDLSDGQNLSDKSSKSDKNLSDKDISVNNNGQPAQLSLEEKNKFLETLRERMHIIESIGRSLSNDFHITIEKGEGWAYNFKTNTIYYKEDDLIGRSEDYALGVILHEAGHRRYSLMYEDARKDESLRFLWNAVEDPRINNLMISRYAGAKPFFKTIYDEDLLNKDVKEEVINLIMKERNMSRAAAEVVASMVKNIIPRHMQYAFGIIYDWYTDGQRYPYLTDEMAIESFEKTKDDFRYAISLKRDIFKKDLTSKEVKKQSDEAFKIVQDKLFPEYKKLLEEDQKDMAQSLANQKQQQQPPQQMPPMGGQSGQGSQSCPSGQSQGEGSEQSGDQNESKEGGKPGSGDQQQSKQADNKQSSQEQGNKKDENQKKDDPSGKGDNSSKTDKAKEDKKNKDTQDKKSGESNNTNPGNEEKEKQGAGDKEEADDKKEQEDKKDAGGNGKADDKKEQKEKKDAGGNGKGDDKKEQKEKKDAGGNGKGDDKKEQKDKQGANGQGKPDKPMPKPTEEDMRAAEKIFEEMEKGISDKLESKEEQSKNGRNSMPGKQSSDGKQKNEKSEQGEKPGQDEKSEQGEKTKDGKKSGQGEKTEEGNEAKDGDKTKQGDKAGKSEKSGQGEKSGDKNGDIGKSDDGTESNQSAGDGRSSGNSKNAGDIDLPTLQELYEQQRQLEKHIEGIKTPYERYSTELAPFVDEMSGELKNLLEENASPKFVGDFSSGKKINLRKAMEAQGKYEVRGEFDPNVWMRKDLPSSRDYGFVFVVDESGSMMEFDKWENAKKALILCSEALERLKIKFGVVGFSNSPKVHKQINDKYDEVSRERVLADVESSEHGGTNDSDALAVGVNMVKETSSEQIKVVIVISDGAGKEGELRAVIEKASREGIKVIGVGIGDGMAYVKQVYPKSLAVPNVQDLPFKLADLLEEEILGGFTEEF